jgi:hypothetical protein
MSSDILMPVAVRLLYADVSLRLFTPNESRMEIEKGDYITVMSNDVNA